MSDSGQKSSAGRRVARIFKEVGGIYLAALVLILVFVLASSAVPLLAQNLYAVVAAVFVGLPYWWLNRKDADFDRYGLSWDDWGRGALWGLLFTALTIGPFAVGYWWWETEVQQREFEFSGDNFFAWPVEYEGRPSAWGSEPGVWVWTRKNTLNIGMRAGDEPVEVAIEAPRPFRPGAVGPVDLDATGDAESGAGLSDAWTMRLDERQKRAHVFVGPYQERSPPRRVEITSRHPTSGEAIPIRRGAAAQEVDGSVDIERGLSWILLWVLTQFVFIALPEEFFYRGYIQTRLRDMLEARRKARGKPVEGRRVWGFTAENAITSVLFAVGHVLIPIGGVLIVTRASVFFPSLLFGWLRDRTGSIAAPIVYHAASNLMVLLAAPHFF